MVGVFKKVSGIFSCTVNLEDLFQPQSADLPDILELKIVNCK